MLYQIEITEILKRVVPVEAASASEALNKTINKYNNSEIILDADDYEGVGFNEIASWFFPFQVKASLSRLFCCLYVRSCSEILCSAQEHRKKLFLFPGKRSVFYAVKSLPFFHPSDEKRA